MNEEKLVITKKDGVGTITLNRPDKLNAIDYDVMHELVDAIKDFSTDSEVRVVVITGTGRAFSAGGDVKAVLADVGSATPEQREQGRQTLIDILGGLRKMPKPVIAALNGLTVGAGLYLALACDIVIASDTAYFQNAFIRYGLHPDFGGTYFLPRVVGTAKACELMFTAMNIDAAEALRIGLVNRVVPHDELYTVVEELCDRIKGFYGPTLAAIKSSIYELPQLGIEEAITRELDTQLNVITSDPEAFHQALLVGLGKFDAKTHQTDKASKQ